MKKPIYISLAVAIFILSTGHVSVNAQQSKPSIKEVTIEVQSGIIALPGGAIGNTLTKVPITSARVRNTELRNLNKLYHVVGIERVYEIKETLTEQNDLISKVKSKKAKVGKFKELEKLLVADGKKVDDETLVQLKDVFTIELSDYMDSEGKLIRINIDEAVAAYNALSVVVSAAKK